VGCVGYTVFPCLYHRVLYQIKILRKAYHRGLCELYCVPFAKPTCLIFDKNHYKSLTPWVLWALLCYLRITNVFYIWYKSIERPFTVCCVSFTVFPWLFHRVLYQIIITRKAYHRGLCELYYVPLAIPPCFISNTRKALCCMGFTVFFGYTTVFYVR
jgi:hypothetical protein